MTRKIFRSILAVATAVLILSFTVITGVLYNHSSSVQKRQLETELYLLSEAVQISGKEYLLVLKAEGYRITWVDRDGTVLYDTQADAATMGNHKDREEINEAFDKGKGESSRYSATLTEKTMYCAILLNDGTVLRMSASHDSIWALVGDVMFPFTVVLIVAVILSGVLARKMAKVVVTPLNSLNLDNPLENDTYEELSPLLVRISKQHKQIDEQVNILKKKADEFDQIISAMNEGLVLVNEKGIILSINKAAQNIFGIDGELVGENYLMLDHSLQFSRGMAAALGGEYKEFRAQKNGREYQCDINGIESNGKVIGAVLLVFDITEAAYAERNRQEFTANVSHELKTPLQSIIGSAELLENNLVKQEDIPRFVGHIKTEASRLVVLINDIIRLSQLDENGEAMMEDVDLYELAKEVADVLADAVVRKNVTFEIQGGTCIMSGVRRYLYEIIFNLCDNAIRYNCEGGKVIVHVDDTGMDSIITVSDTGIGIEPEHHTRIFERFYRVDKSHSKETGGTGLGLSIVKHAVMYHGGRLEMESKAGKGTTIKVIFQK